MVVLTEVRVRGGLPCKSSPLLSQRWAHYGPLKARQDSSLLLYGQPTELDTRLIRCAIELHKAHWKEYADIFVI